MQVSSDDRLEELHAAGVELVAGSVTDLAGVTRAKYVPLRRLEDFGEEFIPGECLDCAVCAQYKDTGKETQNG